MTAVALVSVATVTRVQASGPNELMAQIARDPMRLEHFVVRYTNVDGTRRGVLVSDDGGKNWRLMCSDAIHAQAVAAGLSETKYGLELFKEELRHMRSVTLTDRGETLVNTSMGLLISDATGCGFHVEAQFLDQDVKILDHPRQPGVKFALLGWEGSAKGMWRRAEDGTWSRFGVQDDEPKDGARALYKSAVLAANDSDVRVYQAVWRLAADAGVGSMSVRVSDDGARTWREHPITLPSNTEELELLAVDPTDRNRVVGVVRRSDNSAVEWSAQNDTVMLSIDGGQNFVRYHDVAQLTAAAFGPDGTLWISDGGASVLEEYRAGLFRAAPGLTAPPTQLSRVAHQCVTYAGDAYYACQDITVGKLDPQTGAIAAMVRLDTVAELATCPGIDMKNVCREMLCTKGYCLYTHYPRAPLCKLYDSMLCGPSSIGESPDAALDDAGGTPSDAGETSPAPDAEIPRADAGPAAPSRDAGSSGGQNEDPAGADPSGCDCGVAKSGGNYTDLLGWLGAALVLQLRRRRFA